MYKILILLLFSMATSAYSQHSKLFKGTINKSLKITLYLQGLDDGSYADRILGSYKYENQKGYILLNGYRNNKGNVVLVEQSSANFSGVFLGTLNGEIFKGEWISSDQKTKHTFTLAEVHVAENAVTNFRMAIENRGNEFRGY